MELQIENEKTNPLKIVLYLSLLGISGYIAWKAANKLRTVKPTYEVLKYTQAVDKQTNILSLISQDLETLGLFTNVISKTDFENEVSNNYYDMFFYFGHGLEDCIFDENNYCNIYADNNLQNKWIVMTSCNTGITYARQSVRDYNAIASIGYLQPLVARFSNGSFMNGFSECFLEAQKTLLEAGILNEDALILAYDNLKNLYNFWRDYYKSINDDWTASCFYANSYSLATYSKWDESTTINIDITPTPAEIWHFGSYIGNAPLGDYNIMSGGNLFTYKAMGCFKSFLLCNILKTGGSYTLTPMTNSEIDVEHYDTLNVYLEYNNKVMVSEYEAEHIEIDYRNYGDVDQNIPNSVTNNKNYLVTHDNFYQGVEINVIKPHGASLNKTYIEINKNDYPLKELPYEDIISISVNMSGNVRTFDVTIHVMPLPPQLSKQLSLPHSLFSSNKFTGLYNQYINMTREEQTTKNIFIHDKLYSPEDIMEEIKKGTDVGMMFIYEMININESK